MVLLDLASTCVIGPPLGSVAIERFGQHPVEARFGVFVRTPPFTKILHQAPWSSMLSLHIYFRVCKLPSSQTHDFGACNSHTQKPW